MSAAKKLEKSEKEPSKLRVIKGGKMPKPTKSGKKVKGSSKKTQWKKPGTWCSALRLQQKTADKLKKKAKKDGMSINTLIETLIETYLKA